MIAKGLKFGRIFEHPALVERPTRQDGISAAPLLEKGGENPVQKLTQLREALAKNTDIGVLVAQE